MFGTFHSYFPSPSPSPIPVPVAWQLRELKREWEGKESMREQKRIKWGLQQALEGHFAEESETCPSEACLNLNFIVFFFKLDSHETSLSVECMLLRILAAPLFSSFCPHCTPGFSRVMPSGKNILKRAWLDYLHTWCFTHCFLQAMNRLWIIFLFSSLYIDPLLTWLQVHRT